MTNIQHPWDELSHCLPYVSNQVFHIAEDKGFHSDTPRPLAINIALIHSELSEALEADWRGNPPSKKVPGISEVEEEFADIMLRLLDTCVEHGIDLTKAVRLKHEYNAKRPEKQGKGY